MASRDSRRITGPEKTVPYVLFQQHEKKSFLGADNRRTDGRTAIDPRKFCKCLYFRVPVCVLQESSLCLWRSVILF